MRRFALAMALSGVAVGLTLGSHQDARAIAAFSREYKTECVTCHNPFPHRNAFGEAFEKNGYVWPGRVRSRAPEGQEALWLSGLPATLPVSANFVADVAYDSELEVDKLSPAVDWTVQAGGNIQDRFGFFAHDVTSSGGEAFGMFRRVLNAPVNVKFGRFTPKTTLGKADQSFTMTLPAPLTFSVPDGAGPSVTPRDGVELNGVLGHRLFLAGGVTDTKNQNEMNFYGHASYRIGGTDFLGEEPEVDFDTESVWDFLAVTLAAYGLYGTIDQTTFETTFWRAGAEAEVNYRAFTFLVSGVWAEDDDIDGTGTKVESAVVAAEVDYYYAPKYLLSARFENEDVGNAAAGVRRRVIGQASYFWSQNLAVRLEGTFTSDEEGPDTSDTTALFRVDFNL